MSKHPHRELDLTLLADNGLKRGRTTGTCAAAAVKAALLMMKCGEQNKIVQVSLPDGEHFLSVPILDVRMLDDGSCRADVLKDAGDDPDQTHGATIFASVKRNGEGCIRFLAGPGVGVVTEPGISVPIGEPAINPVPRRMMRDAVEEVCGLEHGGLDLTIGCERGDQITRRTFNPRLGIVGGISILGTTGVVEPMSLAAYKTSIEVYIRVALGDAPTAVALRPGNLGITFARDELKLPPKRIVHVSNFIGFALEATQRILQDESFRLDTLWVLGHPGKLAKILDGVWDTHSRSSSMAMSAVAKVARDIGFDADLVGRIAECNTTEAVIELLGARPEFAILWSEVERRLGAVMQEKVPRSGKVSVRLFSMHGVAMGERA